MIILSSRFNMAPPRKALIAVTSAHAPLYPDGKETGLFITEALHPFNVFKKAGFEVDLVSETGSYQPDWLSQQKEWLPDEDRAVWEDHSSEFRSKLDKLQKPSDIKPDNVCYQALTWDFPNSSNSTVYSLPLLAMRR